MTKPPSYWADSEISEPLQRVLDSDEPVDLDAAAVERIGALLETALGAAFDARPTQAAPWQVPSWRLFAIGMRTLAVVSITWWIWQPSTQPAAPVQILAVPTQATPLPVAQLPTIIETTKLDAEPAAAPSSQRPMQQRTHAAHSGKHPNPVVNASAAPGLAEELQGLAQIRTLLTKSPERALAAADEQQQRFARGALGPERELLRLDALLRLGHVAQAQAHAAQLQAAPENHPYQTRIAELMARGGRR